MVEEMPPEVPSGYVLLKASQLQQLRERARTPYGQGKTSFDALSVAVGLLTAKVCGLPAGSWPIADTVDPAELIDTLTTFAASALGQVFPREDLLDILQGIAIEAAMETSKI